MPDDFWILVGVGVAFAGLGVTLAGFGLLMKWGDLTFDNPADDEYARGWRDAMRQENPPEATKDEKEASA